MYGANGVQGECGQPRWTKPIKITTLGDGNVGKTCMLLTYTTKRFPGRCTLTVFDNFTDIITVDGQVFNMTLWDTAGQEEYEKLRPLSYPNTDCFLLCYSVSSRASFENVVVKWLPDIRAHCPDVPIVLVATKTDLRETAECINYKKGKKLQKKIGASRYVECSALSSEGLQEVFIEAVRTVVEEEEEVPKTTGCCCCLH